MVFDDLVDFVGWCQHSGRLHCSEAAAIIDMLLHSRNQCKWKTAFKHKWIQRSELTEDVDKGVGQEVAVVVGHVTLVDAAGSSLYISEDDGVVLHLSAEVSGGICLGITEGCETLL